MASKVRTLIVDDSAYMRVVLKDMLESDPEVEVCGVAKDGLEAVERVKSLAPDVVLLDIQMPRMDGIATLQRIMKENPTRVIMLSAMDKRDDQLPLRALELGAVDFISKPSGPVSIDIVNFTDKIVEIVKTAAAARLEALEHARAPLPSKITSLKIQRPREYKSIVIAASTGGPRALETIFAALPKDLPAPIFIVQHIPEDFSISFAHRLDGAKGPRVVLASDGQKVERGVAYLAPGGRHLKITCKGASAMHINLDDGKPVNFVKPSADVLFTSVANCPTCQTLAVILTGMGSDGANGAMAVKKSGGRVIVQDEMTSIVFGMPRAVIDSGAADKILPLEEIARAILEFLEE